MREKRRRTEWTLSEGKQTNKLRFFANEHLEWPKKRHVSVHCAKRGKQVRRRAGQEWAQQHLPSTRVFASTLTASTRSFSSRKEAYCIHAATTADASASSGRVLTTPCRKGSNRSGSLQVTNTAPSTASTISGCSSSDAKRPWCSRVRSRTCSERSPLAGRFSTASCSACSEALFMCVLAHTASLSMNSISSSSGVLRSVQPMASCS